MKQDSDQLILAPTDLSNFLGCRHLVSLDLRAARGQADKPVRHDPLLEELRARGHMHEKAYLTRLQSEGLNIIGFNDTTESDEPPTSSSEITLAGMRDGTDVIYQATLTDGDWFGRVDFLRKVNAPSALGDWSYEVYDTKPCPGDQCRDSIATLCVLLSAQ